MKKSKLPTFLAHTTQKQKDQDKRKAVVWAIAKAINARYSNTFVGQRNTP